MGTADQLAFSIRTEGRGVHVLLWDDQADLVRALLVLRAALEGLTAQALLAPTTESGVRALRDLVDARSPVEADDENGEEAPTPSAGPLWMIFLPQAASKEAGPWLNGWRRSLAKAPGTLLVIRHADFMPFQRSAPDLASFVGPRISDASTMLSIFSPETAARLATTLPPEWERIVAQLPGSPPDREEIAHWLAAYAGAGEAEDA